MQLNQVRTPEQPLIGELLTAKNLEQRLVSELLPYARNARTHSDAQVEQLARSIQTFGFTNPVLIDGQDTIIAGHGRVIAAKQLGMAVVPCLRVDWMTEAQQRAYVLADNQLALQAGWDDDLLAAELQDLQGLDFDLHLIGFEDDFLAELIELAPEAEQPTENADVIPEAPKTPTTHTGDVWLLGKHRVMCGDSTSAVDAARLMNGDSADLIHADPPYGMGKQSDGVANDNLYREKLDEFQMGWWSAFRSHFADNGGAYIWGNAPDLWRLWYSGGLGSSEETHFCNHLVWDKKNIAGMKAPQMIQYPITTEHCLFFKLGKQFVGNVNTDDYYDGWDVLRLPLKAQADASGLTPAKLRDICGVQMHSHWFTKSQWQLIPQKHYQTLQVALPGFFVKPYSALRAEYEQIKGGYRNHINGIQGGMRTYFDNAHDIMRDVWEFSRVVGDERHGHATPKPVEMMQRVMKSSLPDNGLCIEPFGGSGSTLMGAESTGRRCYSMEMQPVYCDVIVTRWQSYSGQQATLEGDGRTFEQITAERGTA